MEKLFKVSQQLYKRLIEIYDKKGEYIQQTEYKNKNVNLKLDFYSTSS